MSRSGAGALTWNSARDTRFAASRTQPWSVKDAIKLFGEPGATQAEWERGNFYYGRDQPKVSGNGDLSTQWDDTRTIETAYKDRDVVTISVSVIHQLFVERCTWLNIPFDTWITPERNFVNFRYLTNLLPHQYIAHGVPGHTNTYFTEEMRMTKTTQAAAYLFDMRVLQDPIHGPAIVAHCMRDITLGAAMAIILRQMLYLVNTGINTAIYHHLANNARGGVLDDEDEVLALILQNFAVLNRGVDGYNRMLCESLRLVDEANPGATKLIVTLPNFQQYISTRVDPDAARKLLDLKRFLSKPGESQPMDMTTRTTANELALTPFDGMPGVYVAVAPNLPMNDHVSYGNVLESGLAYSEHYEIDPMAILRHTDGKVAPICNPNSIEIYSVPDEGHKIITTGDALDFCGMFGDEGEIAYEVESFVEMMPKVAPYELEQHEFVKLRAATGTYQPYDPVNPTDSKPRDYKGFLFSFWSDKHKKYRVPRIIGQMRHAYLPDDYAALGGLLLSTSFPQFTDALHDVFDWVDTVGSIDGDPAWFNAVLQANTKYLYRANAAGGYSALLGRCPEDRRQGYAIINEFRGNAYGGMDLPRAPDSSIPSSSYGAGYASGPGIRTFASEHKRGKTVYGNLAEKAHEAVTKFDRAFTKFKLVAGSSLAFNTSAISAWFHSNAENALTRVIECHTGGRPLFGKFAQPTDDSPAAAPRPIPPTLDAQRLLVKELVGQAPAEYYRNVTGIPTLDLAQTALLERLMRAIPGIITTLDRSKFVWPEFAAHSAYNKQRIVMYSLVKLPTSDTSAEPPNTLKLAQAVNTFLADSDNRDAAFAAIFTDLPPTALTVAAGVDATAALNVRNKYAELKTAIAAAGLVEPPFEALFGSDSKSLRGDAALALRAKPDSAVSLSQIRTADLAALNALAVKLGTSAAELQQIAATAAVLDTALSHLTGRVLPAQPTTMSRSALANFSWIRTPLVITERSVARNLYYHTEHICVVGHWKTGYATPALTVDDAWSERDEPSALSVRKLRRAFKAASALEPLPVDHTDTAAFFAISEKLVSGGGAATSATDAMDVDIRAADAYGGQNVLPALTHKTTFLGVNLYESALFQQPGVTDWMDGPMLVRASSENRTFDKLDSVTSFLTLAYLMLPLTRDAMRDLSAGRQLVPFKVVLERKNWFNTVSNVVTSASTATTIASPSYTALSVDNQHDTAGVFNRIEAGLRTEVPYGSIANPHVGITKYVYGMNTLFLTKDQIKALGTEDFQYDRHSPCLMAILAPLTVPIPNIIRWDGSAASKIISQTFDKANFSSPGRLATLDYYLYLYRNLQNTNKTHTRLDYLKGLPDQVKNAPMDVQLAPLATDSMKSGYSRYSFRGPNLYYNANGEYKARQGIGSIGNTQYQCPGCGPVYNGDTQYFKPAPIIVSQTHHQ